MITLIFAMAFMHTLLQAQPFFRSSIAANTVPWNVSCTNGIGSNVAANCTIMNSISPISNNMPYFFPVITLMLLVVTDYYLGIKKQVDTKVNIMSVAIAYTVLAYIEVAGGLTTIGYMFLFEIILIATMIFVTLFAKNG
jgi:hypothetical protein